MIKINLLREDNKLGKIRFKLICVATAVVTVLAFAGQGYYLTTINGQLDLITQELTTEQNRLNNLKRKTKTVRDLEKKKKTLKKKLSVLAKLKKSKVGPVRVLDELNNSIPDHVWLKSVSESDGAMVIKGVAITPQDIAKFMENLEASDFFEIGDLSSRQSFYAKDTGGSGRSGKGSSRGSSRHKSSSESLNDNNVRVQEFDLDTKVYYWGKSKNRLLADEKN